MNRSVRLCGFTAPILALCGCASPPESAGPAAATPESAASKDANPQSAHMGTRILDEAELVRLSSASELTLQWISWERRGSANVRRGPDGWVYLSGAQGAAEGPGRLYLQGRIVEVGTGYFTFEGTIRITDTPDIGRTCEATKTWHFAVTQDRPYWRLREFEWCDGLTDYIDIYHPRVSGKSAQSSSVIASPLISTRPT